MTHDVTYAAAATRELINAQRSAIAELVEALQHLVAIVPEPELVSMGYDSPPEHRTQAEHEIGYALHLARAVLTKHAPAQSKDEDSAPWCHVCGARVREECGCGSYADND